MGDVIQLSTIEDTQLIPTLEDMLELAKEGRLKGLIAAGTMTNGEFYTAVTENMYEDVARGCGMIELMRQRYVEGIDVG